MNYLCTNKILTMKKNILFLLSAVIMVTACKKDDDTPSGASAISMGNQYMYDVYYNLSNGTSKKVDKLMWDIAFSVPLQTASILINESAGVTLYCAGDTGYWNTADTASIKYLDKRYNDKSNWSTGAFNHYSISPFNFGWGTYNMAAHNVYGDSIYFIFLSNGACKKFMIQERVGATDTYMLRWANPDGSDEVNASFSPASFSAKNFIHYSIVNENAVVVEPDKDNWDLLFTNYITKIPTGPTTTMDYPVLGVLAKQGIELAKVTGIDPASATLSDTTEGFSTKADLIGWDWKTYDQTSNEYSLVANTCYFVKLTDGSIYKIYFTGFAGSATGDIDFVTKLMN
jgi:hypothetical protein